MTANFYRQPLLKWMIVVNTELVKIILAFAVLMNPFSALGLFLSITNDYSVKQRQKAAQITCIAVFIAITFIALMGGSLLQILGISLGSFRVAGGILVFLIAINMMNGTGNPVKPKGHEVDISSLTAVSVVPLAIPMIVGPGGISTVIIYSSQVKQVFDLVMIVTAGFCISLFCYIALMAAGKISRFLGETGLNILSRIMGMLLAAVAVEIFVGGIRATFPEIFV